MELWLKSPFSPHFHLALMTTAMTYIHYNLERLLVLQDCFINVSRNCMQKKKKEIELLYLLNSTQNNSDTGLCLGEDHLSNGQFTQYSLKLRGCECESTKNNHKRQRRKVKQLKTKMLHFQRQHEHLRKYSLHCYCAIS